MEFGEFFSFLLSDESLLKSTITAVTIIDNPYSLKDDQSYDESTGECVTGIKCRYRSPTDSPGINATWLFSCCTGYVVELFGMMLNDLNLEVDMYIVEDGKYGVKHNNEWNGMINDLIQKKADVAVGSIAITGDRSAVVDFTSPWMEIDLGVLVKPKNLNLPFLNFEFIA